jgi:DNA-binding LytR/AlgR family response regulator
MTLAICEDDELQRDFFVEILRSYFGEKHIHCFIKEYISGNDLIFDYEENHVFLDVIFLDIGMPGINGIETARKLRSGKCNSNIFFTTASKDYAIDGYEVDAKGYFLKPYDTKKIFTVMDRIMEQSEVDRYAIQVRSQILRLPIYEIVYVESANTKCLIHCKNNVVHSIYKKLGDVEQEINDKRFLRCHQSYLVNMDYIKSAKNDFELIDGSHVPIRQRTLKDIKDIYYSYIKG